MMSPRRTAGRCASASNARSCCANALAGHLARLSVEADAVAYERQPFTAEEVALDAADDWGPAEEWSDWEAWADRRDHAAG